MMNNRNAAILLLALVGAAYWDVLIGINSFVARDFGLLGYPSAYFFKESFWSGEFPHWNPYNNCGIPFHAQWTAMVLYPFSLVYLLLPMPWSLNLFCVAHVYLGALGMYFLALSWTRNPWASVAAGILFSFSGYMASCLTWPQATVALGWMPWVLRQVEQGWMRGGRVLVVATAVSTLQMLAGPPEYVLFTWGMAGFLCLVRLAADKENRTRRCMRLGLMVVMVSLLSAPQILPFFQLLGESSRMEGYTLTGWEMPPAGWANYWVPLFQYAPGASGIPMQKGQALIVSYYGGALGMFFACLAPFLVPTRRVLAVWALWIACLALALGEGGYLLSWLHDRLPLMSLARYPVKFAAPAAFLLCLLSALSLDALAGLSIEARRTVFKRLSIVVAAVGLMILWICRFETTIPGDDMGSETVWKSGITRIAALMAGIAFLWQAWNRSDRRVRPVFMALFLGVLWVDLITHHPNIQPRAQISVLSPGLPPLQAMESKPEWGKSRAVLSLEAYLNLRYGQIVDAGNAYLIRRLGLYANCNILEGIPKVDGFWPMFLQREHDVRVAFYNAEPFPEGLADFLAVGLKTSETNDLEWTGRPSAMPLVYGGAAPKFHWAHEIPTRMADESFDPRQSVWLSNDWKDSVRIDSDASVLISNVEISPREWTFRAEATGRALVTLAQCDYPGWKAEVNGRSVPILPANHAFQAIEVPEGRSEARVFFREAWFRAGWIGFSLGALGCFGIWFASRRSINRQDGS